MADARLSINSRNYGSWSLRGWLLCRMAGLDVGVDMAIISGHYADPGNNVYSTFFCPLPQIGIVKKSADGDWAVGVAAVADAHLKPLEPVLPTGKARLLRESRWIPSA